MREQLQRSMNVREQQRSIIEARLQQSAKGDGPDSSKGDTTPFGPQRTGKRRPPPGLSIVPPSASQFANERVIQSAPLNQTFTGRRQPQPLTRHFLNHPADVAASPHIHHTPANQTNNRLPPIADVFGADALSLRDRDASGRGPFGQSNPAQSSALAPLPSPGPARWPAPKTAPGVPFRRGSRPRTRRAGARSCSRASSITAAPIAPPVRALRPASSRTTAATAPPVRSTAWRI
ncbi:conserved hypothetical protein [Uncinocarpus reesii 1704]|uniref:Uncharacterized protein n=1 Tax=Uncinocarpus reesii (strain UAMH 1704) TaxID=336963 RepID=C4JP12_UNCRE|nr:uncharacterized protein UREG_03071 [Uncinocarpus reesii 1704]EEP78226.1 conserved hypothetical protein [Uncinocarpus reesii 1704]